MENSMLMEYLIFSFFYASIGCVVLFLFILGLGKEGNERMENALLGLFIVSLWPIVIVSVVISLVLEAIIKKAVEVRENALNEDTPC